MAQGNDTNGDTMQAFELPDNGACQLKTSATGAVIDMLPATRSGFYEFTTDADCFLALGTGAATIPVTPTTLGGLPLTAGVTKVYEVPEAGIVSAIGASAFNLTMTEV